MRYRQKHPVDQGYSWVLLAACYVSYLITAGIIKSYGILYSELIDVYHSNARTTSSIGTTSIFVQAMLCPVAINLCTLSSFRGTMFAAGIAIGFGFLLSSFVYRVEFLFITYSFISGIGFALSLGSSITAVNFYFVKRRGLANGILVSASGVGSFVFPYLYTFLFSIYGLNGALIVMSGITLQGCIGATVVRQPVMQRREETSGTHTTLDEFDHIQKGKQTLSKYSNNVTLCKIKTFFKSGLGFLRNSFTLEWRLFKNYMFLLNIMAFISTVFGWQANFFMLPAHIEDIGYTKKEAAFATSVIGLSELCGRIVIGWFVDLNILAPKYIYMISMLISGIAQVCVPFLSSYEWFCVYAGIVGMFPGSFFTLLPLLLVDKVGQQKFPAAFGLVIACTALFTVITYPALGWLKDYLNSWNVAWFITGAFTLLSSALAMLDTCLARRYDERDKIETEMYIDVNSGHSMRQRQDTRSVKPEETAMLD